MIGVGAVVLKGTGLASRLPCCGNPVEPSKRRYADARYLSTMYVCAEALEQVPTGQCDMYFLCIHYVNV